LTGDQDDIEFFINGELNPLLRKTSVAPEGCFRFVDPKDQEKLEALQAGRTPSEPLSMPPLQEKKKRGNPNWGKKLDQPIP